VRLAEMTACIGPNVWPSNLFTFDVRRNEWVTYLSSIGVGRGYFPAYVVLTHQNLATGIRTCIRFTFAGAIEIHDDLQSIAYQSPTGYRVKLVNDYEENPR